MISRLDEIAVDLKSVKHEINELRNSIQYREAELDSLVNRIQNIELQSNIVKNATDIALLKDENVQLRQKLGRYEAYSRRDNLVVRVGRDRGRRRGICQTAVLQAITERGLSSDTCCALTSAR